MALIVGEPFGNFGTMMPQGHTSVYFADLCAETPVELRPCHPGELGAVVSRYHDLRHPELDWMAFPLPVFLYGTADLTKVPASMTGTQEAELREGYWQANLTAWIAGRTDRHGHPLPPAYGDWEEGIGAAFDRRLLVYSFNSTPEADATALRWLNDRPNRRSYTLGRHNCADFVADLLRIALPRQVIHRNVPADFDMTTPKTLALQVGTYGHTHPELDLHVYEVPQIPGTLRRSRPLRGAAETFVKTKRYVAALVVLQPELLLADWLLYETRGRWHPGGDAQTIAPSTWLNERRTHQDPAVTASSTAPTNSEPPAAAAAVTPTTAPVAPLREP